MSQSILILSGGLDSTVSSWIAARISPPVLALTFDYGQKAARREQDSARKTAERLNVPHRVLALPWLAEVTTTALVDVDSELPTLEEKDLDDPSKNRPAAEAVWVPNRNGLFLNIAASYAEALQAEILVTGFNAEEGITFPDNSAPFVRAANEFFWYSTLKKIRVVSHTLYLTKVEIVRKAALLGVPLQEIWSCYTGGPSPCRRCESCLRTLRAFREARIKDPWMEDAH